MLVERGPGTWREDAAFCELIDWYMALATIDGQLESKLSIWLANEIGARFDRVLTANLVSKTDMVGAKICPLSLRRNRELSAKTYT